MTLYHPKIGFPPSFRRPVGPFNVELSRHAQARAEEKGITLPTKINLNDYSIVEIEMNKGMLTKIVIRGEHDKRNDLCMAIMFKRGKFFIKTAWLNDKGDMHSTLDHSRYAIP